MVLQKDKNFKITTVFMECCKALFAPEENINDVNQIPSFDELKENNIKKQIKATEIALKEKIGANQKGGKK